MNVYVDTGGWVAYFDQSDRFHPLVTSYLQATLLQAVDRLVTSDYVLDETVSYLRYHVSHATALTAFRTLSALAQAHRLTMLEVNREIRAHAGQILEQFHDQTFSFTDCTSFALCEAHHIQHAVTVDKGLRHLWPGHSPRGSGSIRSITISALRVAARRGRRSPAQRWRVPAQLPLQVSSVWTLGVRSFPGWFESRLRIVLLRS